MLRYHYHQQSHQQDHRKYQQFTPSLHLSRLAAAIAILLSPYQLYAAPTPDVMKADIYNADLFSESHADKIADYYVSEKLDGIRAIWTGTQLVTRSGRTISAPAWFTDNLPKSTKLDGELWAGRGSFQQVAATVLDKHPNEKQWKAIKFMVFDLPSSPEGFEQRLSQLNILIRNINKSHIKAVPQQQFTRLTELNSFQVLVIRNNGEGLMLQHKDNLYQNGRSELLLKLKPYQDAEAVVIGYEDGKGKYQGKMGSVWVLTTDNLKFKIGSGFSDAERENPPAIGSVINFRYNGYTDNGIPRFARFVKVRPTPEI